MVDLELLKRKGYSQEALKEKFESKDKPDKLKKWIERAFRRQDEGIRGKMEKSRFFYAIDRAYEVTQRQITFTLVESLLSKKPSTAEVLDAAKSWGIENMLVDAYDNNGQRCCGPNGEHLKRFDLPTFFHIFVPIVAAYTKIRWAKLFNDRDLWPLYPYDPLKLTLKNKMKSAIITDRISRMSTEMGYREDEKQSILQMLLYGECLNLPKEEWYKEEQEILDGDKEKTITVREGVRFAIPHPTRYCYDLAHRACTLNTDTGSGFSLYWDMVRYSEFRAEPAYWNKEDVTYGRGKWNTGANWNTYSMFYPCVGKFPTWASKSGTGVNDRVEEAFRYSADEGDAGVAIVNYFEKVVPSEIGLFEYDHPVWMRFVFAGDDTVAYAAPMAYSPNVLYQYDPDHSRAFNTPLALELLPWQDHMGNYLTQKLLSVKRNLRQVVFWNAQGVKQDDIDRIANLGNKQFTDPIYIPLKPRELAFAQTNQDQLFWPVNFPQINTQEIDSAILLMLQTMERMLGFSSQEIGSSAAHEESATEVNIKHQNTSIRLDFTGHGVDSAMSTRKRLLYDAMMAYSNDEVFAEIGEMNDKTRAALKEIGFEVEEEADGTQTKAGVKGKKSGLLIDGFASSRSGAARGTDSKVVQTMIQTFQSIFSNPIIVQAYGVEVLVEMFNQILTYAGLPTDFRLKIDPSKKPLTPVEPERQAADQQKEVEGIQKQMVEIASAVMEKGLTEMAGAVKELVKQETQPIAEATVQVTQALAASVQQQDQKNAVIEQVLAKLSAIISAASTIQPPPPNVPITYDSVGGIPAPGVEAPGAFPMVAP